MTHFLVLLAACAAAAATGTIFSPGAWYDALNRPAWTPPRWAFPVAWTTLYILIALSGARIATLSGPAAQGVGLALSLWALQIALNTLWTPTFFGAHRIGVALIVMAVLWLVVAVMVPVFWRLDRLAGLLLLPYLGWLSLAGALNFWIWRNNPAG